eukprot:g20489.t1
MIEYSDELDRIRAPVLPIPSLKKEKDSGRYTGTIHALHYNRYGRSKRIQYGFLVPDKAESLGDYITRAGILENKLAPAVKERFLCRIFFHISEVLDSVSTLPDTGSPVSFELDLECGRGNGLRAFNVRFLPAPPSAAASSSARALAPVQRELASFRESLAKEQEERKNDLANLRVELVGLNVQTEERVKKVEESVAHVQAAVESSIRTSMDELKSELKGQGDRFIDLIKEMKGDIANQVHNRLQNTLLSDEFLRNQQDRVEGLTQRSQPAAEQNEEARPAHPPRTSFHNEHFLEQLLDALGGLSADLPEPGHQPAAGPPASGDEYIFEDVPPDPPTDAPAAPAARAEPYRARRADRRRRVRVRARADEVNVLSLNAQGRGESESLHSRIRHLLRQDHGLPLGATTRNSTSRPPIDAIFLQEFSYTKIGADAPEWKSGPGEVLWQFGDEYDIVFSNGAGIVIANELWRKWVRDGRCETFGCPRAVALRLPSLSLASVYAPAAGGNARKNDVEWWHFTDYLLRVTHWARRIPRGSESQFPAGNRTVILSSDNCGVIGDRVSREKKGYVAGLTSGPFGLTETNDRGVDALQLFEEARVVLANSYFDQPSGPSPLGLNFSDGRETHFSRRAGGAAGGRWRELDHMWVDAASVDRVRACGTIDFGVSDHRSKYLSIGIDRQFSHQASRRKQAATQEGEEPSPPPAPRVPLWRATDEAKGAFSRQVEAALAASEPEGPDLK